MTYRKSSYSESSNCVEVDAVPGYRKSSRCTDTEFCVEAASAGPGVLIRDSKDVTLPSLNFAAEAWSAFTERVKTEF